MSLSEHVRTLGRGPGRSRALTQEEAAEAMALMLRGDAAPEAVGALLMLLRMKGETAPEIAGFASAAQAALPKIQNVDLDWPCYAAGRTRGAPLFLLSATLLADDGHRVLLHGWNGTDTKIRDGLSSAGIEQANSIEQAEALLSKQNIAYLPLEQFHPNLFDLLNLRAVLGLRSCINTVCRMLNPGRSNASVQGVFHPSYRLLQADAAALLNWSQLCVIKGGGGEFERHPSKQIEAFGLRDGVLWDQSFDALSQGHRRLAEEGADFSDLWAFAASSDFARDVVIGTAELALATIGVARAAERAAFLWDAKTKQPAE